MKKIQTRDLKSGEPKTQNVIPFITDQLDAIHLENKVKNLQRFSLGLVAYLIEKGLIKEEELRDILQFTNPPCTYESLKIVEDEL